MEKPLPDIPAPTTRPNQARFGNNLTTLTVEAHEHLHKLLTRLLEDEDGVSNQEEWVDAIQGALRGLGECIAVGGWLAGLKRARLLRKGSSHTLEGDAQADKSSGRTSEEVKGFGDGGHAPEHAASRAGSPSKDTEELRRDDLESLQLLVQRPTSPTPKPRIRHLLLSVAPYENFGFRNSEVGCRFTSGKFTLPDYHATEDEIESILHGLDDWSNTLADQDTLQIVGGTFMFTGQTSSCQHAALRKVLRVALYTYLSMILEQHFLSNSHASLRLWTASSQPVSQSNASVASAIQRALSTPNVGYWPKRDGASSLWSFLSRKKDDLVRRAVDVAPMFMRRGSLDLPSETSSTPPARNSEDNSGRQRRISLIGDFRPSFMMSPKESPPEVPPFAATLSLLKKHQDSLSTSPGVTFAPPALIVRLAEKESRDADRRLSGDERAALTSILGWTTKTGRGNGMAGIPGFVLQQGLCALYTENTPSTPPGTSRSTTPASHHTSFSSSSSSSSVTPVNAPQMTSCHGNKKKWITYRYWERDAASDETLGEAVIRICTSADDSCHEPKCTWKRGEHQLLWTHATIRIAALTTFDPEDKISEHLDDTVQMWEGCQLCGKESRKEVMSDGTYLFSFAKYLELLIYSPAIIKLAAPLCEHTTLPPRPWAQSDMPLPKMRMNIVRYFGYKGRQLSFTISAVEDVFEVSVPRLQIIRGKPAEKEDDASQEASTQMEPDRRALRREIMKWWQGLAEHMDQLEANFGLELSGTYHKSLPRLPSASMDDAYDLMDESDEGEMSTPKARPLALPPPNTPQTHRVPSGNSIAFPSPDKRNAPNSSAIPESENSSLITSSAFTGSSTDSDSLHFLLSLRHSFQRTEQSLYSELAHTTDNCLNDVRRSFHTAAKGATRRLTAWQAKHMPSVAKEIELSTAADPSWWSSECHAVPGSNVIVRNNDWGSIIAFTLSSQDYIRELRSMSTTRSQIIPTEPPPTPASNGSRPSFFSKGKWFPPATPQPDPDQDDAVWQEPEEYSAVISRKEHPKDPASLLMSIPEVLRKAPVDLSTHSGASRFINANNGGAKGAPPPLVRAKPEVQVSMQAADALLSGVSSESVDRIISELEAVSDHPRSRTDSGSDSQASSSSFFEANIRRGKASSIMTTDSDASTIGPPSPAEQSENPPPLPPKTSDAVISDTDAEPRLTESSISGSGPSVTETLTNTLTAALRYMVKVGDLPPTPATHHHGLLSTSSPAIDERPHIKYDWTIGKRLKFSCTVYYAKQFDSLRRRCGIEDTFLRSLSRSENWAAEGGKSKSNFWRTSDNQYIIKTLVNAWNVADLQVLIDLGPSYFRYMDSTATKATVIAKLLGFYTIEIRNLETGNVQAKADLLIMENLFYNQNIAKTFDLKGIQGRKVKASSRGDKAASKTLFDGEWIEGQQRALTLVHPHSKAILTEAIRSDCEFLARSNIMDYSLLLGICEERKHIACGLVDAIGSYTFAKTLEYKAKQGLSAGREVTVIPPAEYQERFVNAMDSYFLACPDKWSRPLDDTPIPNDYRKLPSVL